MSLPDMSQCPSSYINYTTSYTLLKMGSCGNSERCCFQTKMSENNFFWPESPQLLIAGSYRSPVSPTTAYLTLIYTATDLILYL